MLDNLTQRLSRVVKTLRGEARLTEANTQEMLREVRMALLEADVALPVVREFVAGSGQGAGRRSRRQPQPRPGPGRRGPQGTDRADGRRPGRRLRRTVAGRAAARRDPDGRPAGRGQDHHHRQAGALAVRGPALQHGRKTGKKKVLVVSADVYRPAAIEQLKAVAAQVGVDFLPSDPSQKPEDIARNAIDHARRHHYDVLILDTAGRLGIDEAMMREIRALHDLVKPVETLFVVDAMQGQDAVNTARAFADALPLTGVVLTKLDGDARGGAALSVRHVTGKPPVRRRLGKLDGLEPFYPERMAQRVLGMGDIVSLVEQAQKNIDIAEAQKLASKIKSGNKFDLNDFRDQLGQVKLGDMGSLLEKLPAQFQQAAGQLQGGQAESSCAARKASSIP